MNKSYSELVSLPTFEDRLNYLRTNSVVGQDTFGSDRYLNQDFYQSPEWKKIRRDAIVRDEGCDLGIDGLDIFDRIIVHHINPITVEDIKNGNPSVCSLDNLICCSDATHKSIHYGSSPPLYKGFVERKKNDTCPWR